MKLGTRGVDCRSMFDLANVVQPLGLYYQQASEAYEQACTRYVNTIINSVSFKPSFHSSSLLDSRIFSWGLRSLLICGTRTPASVGMCPRQIEKGGHWWLFRVECLLGSGADCSQHVRRYWDRKLVYVFILVLWLRCFAAIWENISICTKSGELAVYDYSWRGLLPTVFDLCRLSYPQSQDSSYCSKTLARFQQMTLEQSWAPVFYLYHTVAVWQMLIMFSVAWSGSLPNKFLQNWSSQDLKQQFERGECHFLAVGLVCDAEASSSGIICWKLLLKNLEAPWKDLGVVRILWLQHCVTKFFSVLGLMSHPSLAYLGGQGTEGNVQAHAKASYHFGGTSPFSMGEMQGIVLLP